MLVLNSVCAAVYDAVMARAERDGLAAHRARTVGGASGRVLELGAGTGLNLRHYRPSLVSELILSEPESQMVARLQRRVAHAAVSASIVRARAEELPFAAESFDVVVSTLVLCSVRDLAGALTEVHRVLRPGGRLLFIGSPPVRWTGGF